ncbi:hypothetical protein P7K49_008553, partial [Saguinus oedipus]
MAKGLITILRNPRELGVEDCWLDYGMTNGIQKREITIKTAKAQSQEVFDVHGNHKHFVVHLAYGLWKEVVK